MFNTGRLATMALFGALAINTAYAEDKSAALVNGISIPQSRIDIRVKAAAQQGQPDTPELRKAIREDMINLEVLAQEASKLGLDKSSEAMQQLELARQSVLANAFVQDYVQKHPISDDVLKKEYDQLKANAIIAQLGKKAKFEKLAAKSKDAGSAEHGGELDWAVPSNFVPPFASAMVGLKKGEYTKEPVESQYGWHVIKLDDVRELKVQSFEELKPQLQQRMQQQMVQNAISEMRDKAKIE
jgi:peptidyl-prolyl cis-trans isomerase C